MKNLQEKHNLTDEELQEVKNFLSAKISKAGTSKIIMAVSDFIVNGDIPPASEGKGRAEQ